jgi:signal transduction histidine kinase
LGLSKCWRIAELHGGTLEVASELGKGATISLHLPKAGPSAKS